MAQATRPRLWMFAGPNGAGKSTFYGGAQTFQREAPFWIVNPDLLTTEIAGREGMAWLEANGRALDRIMTWLEASIAMYRPVGFETVFSSDKYFPLIDNAIARGFDFHLIYVALRTPELHLERIRRRVSEGGHDVDPTKVLARRLRSFENLERVLPRAAFAQIWDNSGAESRLLFEKRGGEIVTFDPDAIPEITVRVQAASAQ